MPQFDPNAPYAPVANKVGASAPAQFDPNASYSAAPSQPQTLDLSNSQGQGLYQMTDTAGKAVGVPYGQVQSAKYDHGYKFASPDEGNRYSNDLGADPKHKVTAGDYFGEMLNGTNNTQADQIIGGAKGAADTVLDVTNLGAHAINGAGHALGNQGDLVNNDPKSSILGKVGLNPDSMEAKNGDQLLGKGAEGIAEFMLGDEALKSLSLGERLLKVGKVAKFFESAPTLVKNALDIGMNALRQGTVGGVQGTLQSDADNIGDQLVDGAKEGGITAITAGVLDGAGKVGESLSNTGKRMTDTAKALDWTNTLDKDWGESNLGKQDLADLLKSKVDDVEQRMKDEYGAGLESVKDSLKGVSAHIEGSPLQKAAKEWIADGSDSSGNTLVDAAKGVAPVNDSMKVLLDRLANPASDASVGGDALIDLRKALGKQYRRLPYGDVNRNVINNLRSGIDDTLESMGSSSDAFKALQAKYADTKELLKDTTVKKLQKGDLDDVTKYLTSGGNMTEKVKTLGKLFPATNDGGMMRKLLGNNMFLHMVQDATDDAGRVDMQQLARRWSNIPKDTKVHLFGGYPIGETSQRKLDEVVLNSLRRGRYATTAKVLLGLAGVGIAFDGGRKGNVPEATLGLIGAAAGVPASKIIANTLTSPSALRAEGATLRGIGAAAREAGTEHSGSATTKFISDLLSGSKRKSSGYDSLSGSDK